GHDQGHGQQGFSQQQQYSPGFQGQQYGNGGSQFQGYGAGDKGEAQGQFVKEGGGYEEEGSYGNSGLQGQTYGREEGTEAGYENGGIQKQGYGYGGDQRQEYAYKGGQRQSYGNGGSQEQGYGSGGDQEQGYGIEGLLTIIEYRMHRAMVEVPRTRAMETGQATIGAMIKGARMYTNIAAQDFSSRAFQMGKDG
ncbi:unnamed protein product, partial [Ixodes hexagonus]